MPRRVAAPPAPLALSLFLCLAALLCAVLTLPSSALAVETMEKDGPPPPTPGWSYGSVNVSPRYETWPSSHYKVTMTIKSPANIWFRYIYKDGPGPRWYHVRSGHVTKVYPCCVAVQAFGVHMNNFGPDTYRRINWNKDQEQGAGSPVDEDASNSQNE